MGKRKIREGYTQPLLYFEQINEVFLMEKMYCMHLARKKTHYYPLQTFSN